MTAAVPATMTTATAVATTTTTAPFGQRQVRNAQPDRRHQCQADRKHTSCHDLTPFVK
jgi:hypothetical protein